MLLRQAREKAGLSIIEAASRVRVCVDYLRRIERTGLCSYPLSQRLSGLYGCSANLFINQIGQTTKARRGSGNSKKAA